MQVMVALSGQLLLQQTVLPSLGAPFGPTLGRNKSYFRVVVAFSGPVLTVTKRTSGFLWIFLADSWL